MGLQSWDVISLEKFVSPHFREPPTNIEIEVSQVNESSLSDEQMEEAMKSSVDLFKKGIEWLQGCFSLISQINHIIDSESSTYEEATKQQVWKDAMIEEL